MFCYGYTVHQAERVLTSAEQRAADAQLGSPRVCAPVDPIA
jgi:hypothetical protein